MESLAFWVASIMLIATFLNMAAGILAARSSTGGGFQLIAGLFFPVIAFFLFRSTALAFFMVAGYAISFWITALMTRH